MLCSGASPGWKVGLPVVVKSVKAESRADRAYAKVKEMAIGFELLPNSRISEADLATGLGLSRTPLREALHRLASEGLVRFSPGQGFYGRGLDPRQVFDLYEVRATLEAKAVELAVQRATAEEIAELRQFLRETGPEARGRTTEELVALDERFHETIAGFSRNAELQGLLRNLNERIRFFRWVNMNDENRPITQGEHTAILDAIEARDLATATALIQAHVSHRMDQIIESIKEGLVRIYISDGSSATPWAEA